MHSAFLLDEEDGEATEQETAPLSAFWTSAISVWTALRLDSPATN